MEQGRIEELHNKKLLKDKLIDDKERSDEKKSKTICDHETP